MSMTGSSRLDPCPALLCCPGKRSAKLLSDIHRCLRLQEHWTQHNTSFKSNLFYLSEEQWKLWFSFKAELIQKLSWHPEGEVPVPMLSTALQPLSFLYEGQCHARDSGSAQEGGRKEWPGQEGVSLCWSRGVQEKERLSHGLCSNDYSCFI